VLAVAGDQVTRFASSRNCVKPWIHKHPTTMNKAVVCALLVLALVKGMFIFFFSFFLSVFFPPRLFVCLFVLKNIALDNILITRVGVLIFLFLLNYRHLLIKETLLALVRDLFTFSSKVIKRFIIV
jgi:hypothetical protein